MSDHLHASKSDLKPSALEGVLLDRDGTPIGSPSPEPDQNTNAHWKSFVFMAGKDTRAQVLQLGPVGKLGLLVLAPVLLVFVLAVLGLFLIGVGVLSAGGRLIRATQRVLTHL